MVESCDKDGIKYNNDVLFSTSNIILLLCNEYTGRIDKQIKVLLKDRKSAYLVLYNEDDDNNNFFKNDDEISMDMSKLSSNSVIYILDLFASIYKTKEELDLVDNLKCSITFTYRRFDKNITFEVIPSSIDGIRDLQSFDYILSQYSMKYDQTNKTKNNETFINDINSNCNYQPNIIAQGLENTGSVARTVLKSSGRYTGHAIRYLGKQYTSVMAPSIKDINPIILQDSLLSSQNDHETTNTENTNDEIDNQENNDYFLRNNTISQSNKEKLIEDAQASKEWAEGVHSVATSITGAILYPVRTVGRIAANTWGKGASDGNEDSDVRSFDEKHSMTRIMHDTLGGLGNGVMNVCKGVTEALNEVGTAIGDSAMHHSTLVYGHDYAQQVTKCYVDAAGEIGLAGYKVANVASIGFHGVIVNAILEGTSYSLGLYEYLVGPVLLQGYMEMMQQPMLSISRYFVVLRPWSISFYKSAKDITQKPYKIIASSMLDTLPKLRMKSSSISKMKITTTSQTNLNDFVNRKLNEDELNETEMIEVKPFDTYTDDSSSSSSMMMNINDSNNALEEINKDISTEIYSSDSNEINNNNNTTTTIVNNTTNTNAYNNNRTTNNTKVNSRSMSSVLTQLNGGTTSHIEICTIDCSTFLLYPHESSIYDWFQELSEAACRVETIAKRKSGADEIAMIRRLNMFPVTSYISIKIKRFILTTPKSISNDTTHVNDDDDDGIVKEEDICMITSEDIQLVADHAKANTDVIIDSNVNIIPDAIIIPSTISNHNSNRNNNYNNNNSNNHNSRPNSSLSDINTEASYEMITHRTTTITNIKAINVELADISLLNNLTSNSTADNSNSNLFDFQFKDQIFSNNESSNKPAIEIQGSIIPVTSTGIFLFGEKHRFPRVSVLTISSYIQEIEQCIDKLSYLLTSNTLLLTDENEIKIQTKLTLLTKLLNIYTPLYKKKFIADWEILTCDSSINEYKSESIELGKHINILGSNDVNRLFIKLNRKQSHISSFTEWGYGEVYMDDILKINNDNNTFDNNNSNDDSKISKNDSNNIVNNKINEENDLWVPMLSPITKEQIGILLITVIIKSI